MEDRTLDEGVKRMTGSTRTESSAIRFLRILFPTRLQRVVAAVIGIVAITSPLTGPALRDWREKRFCDKQRDEMVEEHERHQAAGTRNPNEALYIQQFIERQDFMSRCLGKQNCQSHGLFGLVHDPREECRDNVLFPEG